MNYNELTSEITDKILVFKMILDKGGIANPNDIVDTYNEVFRGIKKPQPLTHCGSCLRRCVRELWSVYQDHLSKLAQEPIPEPLTTQTFIEEEVTAEQETEPQKQNKRGRKPKE